MNMWLLYSLNTRNSYPIWSMRHSHSLPGEKATIWIIARGCIYVVLINVSKLLIHGIGIQWFTFVWFFLPSKITSVDELLICFIRDHGMAPPVCHCPKVIIIVVCDCVSHLYFILSTLHAWILLKKKKKRNRIDFKANLNGN